MSGEVGLAATYRKSRLHESDQFASSPFNVYHTQSVT